MFSAIYRLHNRPEFGRLLRMRRVALPVVFAFALTSLNVGAGNEWIFTPPPEVPENSVGVTPASTAQPPRLPSSETSKSAWINQGDWLLDRLSSRELRIGDPVHIRIFKQSRELELYLEGSDGFELYRIYPICDMSGTLGPKRFEGDYQAPEGFYSVAAERLHPHSDFHLAFNLGYPNAFDRASGRTGSNIMIHGGCASNGCFAMTDYYMEQIYLLAEAALKNGQPEIGVEIYPFRMTEDNLAAHASSRWIDFWRSLKPAHDQFENSSVPAPVDAGLGGYRVLVRQPAFGAESIGLSAP